MRLLNVSATERIDWIPKKTRRTYQLQRVDVPNFPLRQLL